MSIFVIQNALNTLNSGGNGGDDGGVSIAPPRPFPWVPACGGRGQRCRTLSQGKLRRRVSTGRRRQATERGGGLGSVTTRATQGGPSGPRSARRRHDAQRRRGVIARRPRSCAPGLLAPSNGQVGNPVRTV